MAAQSGSYSSAIHGPRALARQAVNLVRGHTRDVEGTVATHVARLGEIERVVREHTGLELSGLDVLDVGTGQRLIQLAYFSRRNRVTGIDRDVIVQGFEPLAYWRMLRTNGALRVAKTIARKALRIDARYRAEVARQVGLERFPRRLPVHTMDAGAMRFADGSFDFVYSLTVLQHLEQPEQAVEEIVRVMRPGAVVYVDLMPYTGRTGSLDIRMIGGGGGELPPWAHLRPEHRHLIDPSAHVNGLGLTDWRRLFERALPGHYALVRRPVDADRQEREVHELWAQGELREFDLDELLAGELAVVWRKPAATQAGPSVVAPSP